MNITERILYLHPDARFICWGNDYNKIEWSSLNSYPIPTLETLLALSQSDIDIALRETMAAQAVDNSKLLTAAVIWIAGHLSLPVEQVRSEIISIYETL